MVVPASRSPDRRLFPEAASKTSEVVVNNRDLEQLYEATAEDLLFAMGTMVVPGGRPSPYIHVFYQDWAREKLEVVREAFSGGLVLTTGKNPRGGYGIYIATRELISIQGEQNGHTSVLRAPAWDARLEQVEGVAVHVFETNRKWCGGFLLLLQTPEWEFVTAVDDSNGNTTPGPIGKRSQPMPLPGHQQG